MYFGLIPFSNQHLGQIQERCFRYDKLTLLTLKYVPK